MPELLPCPFCGNENPQIVDNGIGDFFVACMTSDFPEDDTGCGVRTDDRRCEFEEHAAERWNSRVQLSDQKQEKCGG